MGRVSQKGEQANGVAGLSWAGKARWARQASGAAGPKSKEKTFQNKNWIF
jgi:hypothetical protein